jgi:hypothetical protein
VAAGNGRPKFDRHHHPLVPRCDATGENGVDVERLRHGLRLGLTATMLEGQVTRFHSEPGARACGDEAFGKPIAEILGIGGF